MGNATGEAPLERPPPSVPAANASPSGKLSKISLEKQPAPLDRFGTGTRRTQSTGDGWPSKLHDDELRYGAVRSFGGFPEQRDDEANRKRGGALGGVRSGPLRGPGSERKMSLKSGLGFSRYPDEETRHVIRSLTEKQRSLEDVVGELPKDSRQALLRKAGTSTAAQTIAFKYSSDLETGIPFNAIVLRNRQFFGDNKLEDAKGPKWWRLAYESVASPLMLFLLVAVIVAFSLREYIEGSVVAALIILNTISSVLMSLQAQTALTALNQVAGVEVNVTRGGRTRVVPISDVVVGDIVTLQTGHSVPADIKIIESSDLKVNESILTGESAEVFKRPQDRSPGVPQPVGPTEKPSQSGGAQNGIAQIGSTDATVGSGSASMKDSGEEGGGLAEDELYRGTMVVGGVGRGIVIAVGKETQIGAIATSLAQRSSVSKKTPLEVALDRLGGIIGIIALSILAVIVLTAILTKYSDPSKPFQSRTLSVIILAVGFAVSVMPESLPAVVTTCFSVGCRRLRQKEAAVRRLPAVETLGCCSVICSDKTGTITQGHLITQFMLLSTHDGKDMRMTPITFRPLAGYQPGGEIFAAKITHSHGVSRASSQIGDGGVDGGRMGGIEGGRMGRIEEGRDESERGSSFRPSVVSRAEAEANFGPIDPLYQAPDDPLWTQPADGDVVRIRVEKAYTQSDARRGESLADLAEATDAASVLAESDFGLGSIVGETSASAGNGLGEPLSGAGSGSGLGSQGTIHRATRQATLEEEAEGGKRASLSSPNSTHKFADLSRTALTIAALAAPHGRVVYEVESMKWASRGNALDGALLVAASKAQVGPCVTRNFAQIFDLIDKLSVPFSSSRKLEAAVYSINRVELAQSPYANMRAFQTQLYGVDHFMAIKGAPEIVLKWATLQLTAKDAHTEVLKETDMAQIRNVSHRFAQKLFRVIGIALLPLTDEHLQLLSRLNLSADDRLTYLQQFPAIWIALLVNSDPPKVGVKEAIEACRSARVKVVMITGDQLGTSTAIAAKVGLIDAPVVADPTATNTQATAEGEGVEASPTNTGPAGEPAMGPAPAATSVIDCSKLSAAAKVSEEAVDEITQRMVVYYRARPADKLTIVESLKRQGHVVAMTGDGVNDAPALKEADIGVAMGISGTDVAKSAADLVLLDDNFATMVNAIEEGRRIFNNVQKFVAYLIGTDLGEVAYLTVCIIARLKLPLDPIQILFVNLMCDALPAIALAREPAEKNVMRLPPRQRTDAIVSRSYWLYAVALHVLFVVLCVIAGTLLFTYLATGVLTNTQINRQCKSVNDEYSRTHPYLCQSSEYRLLGGSTRDGASTASSTTSSKFKAGFVTNINFYHKGQFHEVKGAAEGHHPYPDKPPAFFGLDEGKLQCSKPEVKRENGWCAEEIALDEKKLAVNSQGSRAAGTGTFTMAAFAEIFWPYSIRSWLPLPRVLMRNPWLHLGASVPAVAALLLPILPGVNGAFGLSPAPLLTLLAAIGIAAFIILLDETIAKALYRHRHRNLVY